MRLSGMINLFLGVFGNKPPILTLTPAPRRGIEKRLEKIEHPPTKEIIKIKLLEIYSARKWKTQLQVRERRHNIL